MLKAEMHTHTNDDHYEKLRYDYRGLIDRAVEKGYDVLSITHHYDYFFPKSMQDYAKKKGILLISGAEWVVEGYDVLLYNFSKAELSKIKTFADLRKVKKTRHLVVAPHAFMKFAHGAAPAFGDYLDLFDAVEWHFFYTWYFNKNKPLKNIDKPMVGNSDVHQLWQLGKTYTLIDGPKTVSGVIEAIKKGKTKVVSRPLSTVEIAWFGLWSIKNDVMTRIGLHNRLDRNTK